MDDITLNVGDQVDALPIIPLDGVIIGTVNYIFPDGTLSVVFEGNDQEFPYRPDDVALYQPTDTTN